MSWKKRASHTSENENAALVGLNARKNASCRQAAAHSKFSCIAALYSRKKSS